MKTAKLTIGIFSLVLSIIVLFQSCAASFGAGLANKASDTSGGAGTIFALLLIVAGIVSIVSRSSEGGTIAATILYAIAGLIGVTATGIYKDLVVWGAIALIFAVVFLISIFKQDYSKPAPPQTK